MIYPLENSKYQLGCDDSTDIPNLPAYAKSNNIQPGTTCYEVHGGKVLMVDSQGACVAQN